MKKEVVDFIIVGAQKGGTTSLHRYLSSHHKIYMPENKELDYFSNDKYYDEGLKYYHSLFDNNKTKGSLLGEASPQYMFYDKVPLRIYQDHPNVKIIMCLRNPIERAFSHYKMTSRRGKDNRSFQQAVKELIKPRNLSDKYVFKKQDTEYLYFGEYGRIYSNFLKYFNKENILIIFSEDLRDSKIDTLNKILSFLNVDFELNEKVLKRNYHAGGIQKNKTIPLVLEYISKNLPLLKKIMIRAIGRNRISALLHKIETEWNITKNINEETIDNDTRELLVSYFLKDVELLTKHCGSDIPWTDFKFKKTVLFNLIGDK